MKRLFSIVSLLMAFFSLSANAQTWDFSTGVSSADQANLNADAANWTYDSGNDRWCNVNAMTAAEITANDKIVEMTKGLKVTCEGKDQVRLDNKGKRFTLNNLAASLIIPDLKMGMQVTIVACSSNKSTERSITPTNLTKVSGFGKTTSAAKETSVGIVTEDGDVILAVDGGYYFYSISVVDPNANPGGGNGDEPASQDKSDNATYKNASNNQMQLLLADGSSVYYNTSDVKEVSIDNTTVTVKPTSENLTNDYFLGSVKEMSFKKAAPTNADANIVNGGVQITEAKGWLESAYVKFNLYEGAKSYNVYVKGGQFANYTKIDNELVRNYGEYGRADMVGLPEGTYDMKVVAVDASGKEVAASASEALEMAVKAYDRRGFAHLNMAHEIGAYDKTGKLLPNTKILYVSAQTAKTVKTVVKTGSKDSNITECTGIQTIIDAYQKGYDTTPLAVRIIGKVTKEDLDKISSSAEGLQIKGRNSYSHMPITVEGIGDDATVHGFGFLVRNCGYLEMRNFAIMNCMDDCVSMDTDNEHLWIHNLDLFYGQTGGDADQAKGDGTLDIKANSRMTTLSQNHLFDSGKASLCGMGGDGEEFISYTANWFDHSDSRHPRVRCMTVHVLNNYYDGVSKYGVGATTGADIFVESNYFRNCKYPMLISKQGSDVATDSKGTFSGEDGGMIKSFGNKIIGAKRYVSYQENATDFDAYEAKTRDEKVPAEAKCKQGADTYSNFDTDPSKMFNYTPLAADDVPSEVTGWYGAGRLNHGDFKWTFSNAEDADYDVNKALKTAITGYKSSLVGWF